ncbi:MAG: DUF86 domain-containing protein [Bacteroidetes bacterium]|uniref:DUF86 domain-containing protein n=1 Tax=Candidatus Cryptobacteroides merdavium TaxID=2840769 RepID=A0A9D9EFL4_9BACT|nr:DUF86 domain-containing protein [Candidatus Cryptobacteroides merdavium]
MIDSTKDVVKVDEFLVSVTGMVLYNSTLMCLQTIGEALKNVDNLTGRNFLSVYYPQTPWKSIIGLRNIISHEYMDTDYGEIFNIIKEDIPVLLQVIETIINDVESGRHDVFLERLEKK